MQTPSSTADEATSPELDTWLAGHVAGYQGPGILSKTGFGQSNPTYRLTSPSGRYILRRKPFGTLLPKAHAIEREYKVMKALENSAVPVPRALALCEDAKVIGAAFYVMEFVDGRIFYDQTLPGMTPAERAGIYDGMNQAVAALHQLRPEEVGLADYGRTDGFIARQVGTWTKQYRASEGERIEAMEQLIAWLPENMPPEQSAAIFHGDLRLDNMVFHPTEPRVIALLDWELSTLGDPLADLAYHMITWRVGSKLFRGVADLDLVAMGIPNEQDYLQKYLERSGRATLDSFNFYLVFSLFRLAAILQGVWKRAQSGQASASDAEEMGAKVEPLANLAWGIAQSA